jgi:hypothetical protein
MMRRILVPVALLISLSCGVLAQGTKLWSVDRYDDLAKGTSEGVAIRSDGRLEAGPATSLLSLTSGSYIWSLATDDAGNGYAGMGGTAGGSAVVMKITPDGKSTKLFEDKQFGIQALRVLPDGSLVAATSPDGKVYRIPATGGAPTVLFDPAITEEKPKYLWDLAESNGNLFIATGAPAAVYRVPLAGSQPGGRADVLFRTADQHIRCLLTAPDGTLWAGSDGSGVIYRINPSQRDAKPFAVYAATRREITALAIDSSGALYASGVGTKTNPPLPPLPVTGNLGVSITILQPNSTTSATNNTLVPEGSEIYRIAPDGTPSKLLTLKDDVVYALTFRNGQLLAATGNRGRVYRIDIAVPGRFTDLAHLDAAQAMAFAPVKDGLLVATSNSGKLFHLRDRLTAPAIYTSPVFDAHGFAQWGRAETRSTTPAAFDLYARSGNVESPLMGWSDWVKTTPDASTITVPAARFVQWKAVLREGATLDAVALNYLEANIAPTVDEVVVQPGARMAATAAFPSPNTISITFQSPTASSTPLSDTSSPLIAQKDKTAITARWAAHDDNGDTLMFAVFYKGIDEANWHLLKDHLSDRFYSFDSSLLPDGTYTLKVVASDAPVHTDATTLTAEKASDVFVIDTTPPVPGPLAATLEGSTIHAHLEVHDATSPIAHGEYSVDAGPWQYLEPIGKLSDAQTERYDFHAPLPHANIAASDRGTLTNPGEHLLAVRIYDRYENVASVKTVVR